MAIYASGFEFETACCDPYLAHRPPCRDLQAERKHLIKGAFPASHESLEAQRVDLVDIDLRSGVSKELAEKDRVLDLCLRPIEDCIPFVLGILGARYSRSLLKRQG